MNELLYHRRLLGVAQADLDYVRKKDAQYNASWKRRGGDGAWFTIVRPWDRLESMLRQKYGNNLFVAIQAEGLEGPDGSVIACVRDLRRYLLLVEAYMIDMSEGTSVFVEEKPLDDLKDRRQEFKAAALALAYGPGTPEDGGHHASRPDVLWPWIGSWGKIANLGPQCWDLWSSSGERRCIEARITPEQYAAAPAEVRELYSPVFVSDAVISGMGGARIVVMTDGPGMREPVAYWLRIELVPEEERERWRSLRMEQNYKEWSGLMEYMELYDWHPIPQKFILRKSRQAWAEDL